MICCGDFQAVRNEGNIDFIDFDESLWRPQELAYGIIIPIWVIANKIGLSGSDMSTFFPNPLVVDLQLDLNLTRLVCT